MRTARRGRVLDDDRVVEDHQHGAAAELLQRAAVGLDELPHHLVVAAQQAHDLLGLGGVGEGGESAQVEDDDGDLAPVCRERIVHVAGHDALGQMRREEALELGQALQLAELLLHALLQAGVQLGELRCLRLHGVVERLDAQQRAHPREQLGRVDRLGQEVVGAGFQPLDAFLRGIQRGDHHDRQDAGGGIRADSAGTLRSRSGRA